MERERRCLQGVLRRERGSWGKKRGSIRRERRFCWKGGFGGRARAPAPSEKGGSIEPERCCCWGAGLGGTPKRLSVSLIFRGNAAGA